MSNDARPLRRADRQLSDAETRQALERGRVARLGTVGADGWPYVVPLLYVVDGDHVLMHGARAPGHLQANLGHCDRACLEIDAPGEVYAYGRFACDSAISYASVIAFGRVTLRHDAATARRFSDLLMAKYHPQDLGRPAGVYPRLDAIVVFDLALERLTGKAQALPEAAQRWPQQDRTRSPEVPLPPR